MKKHWRDVLIVLGVTIAVYLVMKFMLPVIIPFLIAYFIVRMINPIIEKLYVKFKISRSLSASAILLSFTAIFLFILKISITKIMEQIKNFINNLEVYEARLAIMVNKCGAYLQKIFGVDAKSVNIFIMNYVNKFMDHLQEGALPDVMNQSVGYFKSCIELFTIFAIAFVSVILLSKDYEYFKSIGRSSIYYQSVGKVCSRVLKAGGVYLKAQLTIMAIIAAICVVGLFLIGNSYALIIGLVIGLMDAFPVLGTGTVFVPWALITLLQGDIFHAVAYAVLWIMTWLTREFLEPKFIGKKLGLYPIAIVMTMYIGVNVYGISGVILGPLSLLFILEISREAGVLKEKEEEVAAH